MVISCRSGWVREAWWSTVPSIRSFRRLGGAGTSSSVACAGDGAGPGGATRRRVRIVRSAQVWRHSSVITVTRKEIPMAGRAHPVSRTLTKKRRRKLEQIVRAGSSPQRLVLRARIVLAAAAGAANAAIARDLGCSAAVVRTWRRRFAVRGIPGLFDKPRSGRPETHGPSARLAVLAVATSVPPEGESQWSQRGIAIHLGERGLAISAATVGRVLGEARVRPHKVRGWLNRADDPSFWLRAGQVCRLYLNSPPGTVLISVDEKTGIQAKSRKHPQIPARPGQDARREFEYVRHGTISIIASMNVTTGEVIAERITRNDSQTFTAFLAMLHQMIPPHLRIHLIMDNGSPPTPPAPPPPRTPPVHPVPGDAAPDDPAAPAHPPDHGQRLVPHLTGHLRLARRPPPVLGDLHAQARILAEYGGAVVRGADPQAAASRRLHLPRRPRREDHRVHHPAQQERPPVQVELRRRRRARPLPRTPPQPRTRTSPLPSRMNMTVSNQTQSRTYDSLH